jgi:DNA adenine methylase
VAVGVFRYAPFAYPQGSHYLVKKLLDLIPPHGVYVEVFGGAANLLFAKEPSKVEVYNDINSELVNFFRVLRDDQKWRLLQEKLMLTPYARDEFNLARQPAEGLDEIERARRFFVRIQMSFSGWGVAFRYSHTQNVARQYFNKIAGFDRFHERLKTVIIENLDFEDIFRRYDSPDTFFFCDPPYIGGSVKANWLNIEMPPEDHERLVRTVLQAKGKVLLLGFRHPIYEKLEEQGWQVMRLEVMITFTNPHQTGGKRRRQFRYAWMNYRSPPSSPQTTLTDFGEKPTTT